MIELKNINKSFKVYKRDAGFGRAVKALFSHEYEIIQALDNISFNIAEGEIVGYIGPNGAGKSTSIKIMCGILNPDSGSCVINGLTPYKQRKKYVKDIGVVFGQRSQLWWDVPVIDSFELIRDIYGVDESSYKKSLDEMTQLLNLEQILRTPARNLSLGQRMRCEIAASLLHRPKILFLDEPTIGLDAVSKIAVRNFFKEINSAYKTTIVLTTHDMLDIEALTQRILLIGRGKILLDGNINELKHNFSANKIINIYYSGKAAPALPAGCVLLEEHEGHLCFEINSEIISVSQIIAFFSNNNIEITDLAVTGISSEEMAAQLYKKYNID